MSKLLNAEQAMDAMQQGSGVMRKFGPPVWWIRGDGALMFGNRESLYTAEIFRELDGGFLEVARPKYADIWADEPKPGPDAKHDAGKLRPSLLPWGGFHNVVKVATDGAAKHGDHSWRTIDDAHARYSDALYRHVFRFLAGEPIDDESGSKHLAHIAWNALALLELEEKDDGDE